MAKFRSIKNSLIGGQISPTAQGRTDHPAYPHGCNILRNMIPMLSGGAYRRPGTFFEYHYGASGGITNVGASRLIPFVVSQNEAYMLSVGHEGAGACKVRAFRPTGNSVVSTLAVMTANFFTTGDHPYLYAAPGSPLGYHTNDARDFSRDEIHDVQYAQSADLMWLVHPLRQPVLVIRTAQDAFSVYSVPYWAGNLLSGIGERDSVPYLAERVDGITLTGSATTGAAITVTASTPFFDAKHVGAYIKIFDGTSTYGCVKITAVASSTSATAKVIVTLGDTAAHTTWWESAWSDYRGWPRAVGIFQQRLVFGGNEHQPDSLWFSTSANYLQMSQTTIVDPNTSPTGTQPFTVTLANQQLNKIQWVNPDKQLVVGTSNDEWLIDREDQTKGFGCDNANAVLQSKYGSDYLPAVKVGYELLFALKSQDEIRSYQYNYIDASFFADPIQLLFDEYPKMPTIGISQGVRKFRAAVWDEGRKTLWCIDLAGNLFGMTRERKLGVTSWHHHIIGGDDPTNVGGGYLGSGVGQPDRSIDPAYDARAGAVISIAMGPNPKLGIADLWMVVKRYVNGVWCFHLERMIGKNIGVDSAYCTNGLPTDPGVSGGYQTDATVYNSFIGGVGVVTDPFSGFEHLEEVSPVGTYYSAYGITTISGAEVESGQTTVNTPYPGGYAANTGAVILGLPFTSIIEPLRIEAGSVLGTAHAAIKRINRAFIKFYRTLSAKVGSDPNGEDLNPMETLVFRKGDTPMGYSPELFTGDFKVEVTGTYDRDGYLYIVQDQPLPFCVVSIVYEGTEYDT